MSPPGCFILEELAERNLDLPSLMAHLGIAQDEMLAMLDGRASISALTSEKIGEFFGTSAVLWRNLSLNYRAREKTRRQQLAPGIDEATRAASVK